MLVDRSSLRLGVGHVEDLNLCLYLSSNSSLLLALVLLDSTLVRGYGGE